MPHLPGTVAENDVDRKAHPKGVHLLRGFENERTPGPQIIPPTQTPQSLSSGPRPRNIPRQNSFGGFNYDRAGHVK